MCCQVMDYTQFTKEGRMPLFTDAMQQCNAHAPGSQKAGLREPPGKAATATVRS